MSRIKICGLSREQDIAYVNEAQPDYVGFVMNFPKSHRSVTSERVRMLRQELAEGIQAVGVFVNQQPRQVAAIARDTGIDFIQLHGSESEEDIASLQKLIKLPIIKAFQVTNSEDLKKAQRSCADYILLDSGQGTGRTFDWALLEEVHRPYFLAGGLTPENMEAAVQKLHPFALDISSGVETEKQKDYEKIKRAVAIAHSIEDSAVKSPCSI